VLAAATVQTPAGVVAAAGGHRRVGQRNAVGPALRGGGAEAEAGEGAVGQHDPAIAVELGPPAIVADHRDRAPKSVTVEQKDRPSTEYLVTFRK
jgi:hypothetical protein